MIWQFREWLKWRLAGEEIRELVRWRVTWSTYYRWLVEFPELEEVLANMRAEVDGEALDAGTPPSQDGPWTIEGLRERARNRRHP